MFEDILPIYERPGPFFTNQKCQCNRETVPINWTKKTHGNLGCKCRVHVHFRFFPIVWKRIRVCCHRNHYLDYDKTLDMWVRHNFAYGWYVPQIYHWRFNRKLVLRVTKYIGYHRCDKYCKSPCRLSGDYSSHPVMDERWDGEQLVPIQRSRPKEYRGRYGTIPSNGVMSEFSLWEESEIDASSDICPCSQRKHVRVRNISRISSKNPMHIATEPRKAMRWALRNYLFGMHRVRYRWHWLTQQKRVQDNRLGLVRWIVGFILTFILSAIVGNILNCG